jgi:hypothetical protein
MERENPSKIKVFMLLLENKVLLTRIICLEESGLGICPTISVLYLSRLITCFFTCPIARVLWECVAKCLKMNAIPGDMGPVLVLASENLPNAKEIYVVGVSAIYWALWKARNNKCFENILIKSPI